REISYKRAVSYNRYLFATFGIGKCEVRSHIYLILRRCQVYFGGRRKLKKVYLTIEPIPCRGTHPETVLGKLLRQRQVKLVLQFGLKCFILYFADRNSIKWQVCPRLNSISAR